MNWRCIVVTLAALTAQAVRAEAPTSNAGYVLADGTVQIVGWEDLSGIVERLNALYQKAHPAARFKYVGGNVMSPQHSLIFGETAFAPIGMEFSSNLGSAYQSLVKAPTFSVRIAHGAVEGSGKLSPLAFIVHKSNPLERLAPGQLLHIFTVGGRSADLLFWKQVGVTGALAEKQIHTYGLPESDHYPSEDPGFGVYLFRDKWGLAQRARGYQSKRLYADVTKSVGEDPAGIGVTALNRITPDVKVIGVTAGEWGKPMHGTREEVLSGHYPFDRFLYIYVRRLRNEPMDPVAKEYLRIALSKEGQQAIATDSKGYLPLNAMELATELSKLE
jgi:phosphate transport system substrate-binding protein